MDTIYNIRDLPVGIYSLYKYNITSWSDKSTHLLHAKNEDDKKVKIWSNDSITDIINQYHIFVNFIIYRELTTVTISALCVAPDGEIVIEKNI